MASEYDNLVKINEEDIYESDENEKISLNQLYYEESVENVNSYQSNFAKCQSIYNGKQDIYVDY